MLVFENYYLLIFKFIFYIYKCIIIFMHEKIKFFNIFICPIQHNKNVNINEFYWRKQIIH